MVYLVHGQESLVRQSGFARALGRMDDLVARLRCRPVSILPMVQVSPACLLFSDLNTWPALFWTHGDCLLGALYFPGSLFPWLFAP